MTSIDDEYVDVVEEQAQELVNRLHPIEEDAEILQVLARRLRGAGHGDAQWAIWQRVFVEAAIAQYTVNLEVSSEALATMRDFRIRVSDGRMRQLCGELLYIDRIDRDPSPFQVDTHTYDAILDGFVARVNEICKQAEQAEAAMKLAA